MGCEHFCVSLGNGRGKCVCADGYYEELDRKSCLCKFRFLCNSLKNKGHLFRKLEKNKKKKCAVHSSKLSCF